MFQKDMRLSLLLDFYGEILSQRRRELITLYYDEDFSLSEIAEHTGISRQGVRDSIKKANRNCSIWKKNLHLPPASKICKSRLMKFVNICLLYQKTMRIWKNQFRKLRKS